MDDISKTSWFSSLCSL